jgi:arginyl-tRNA synthetase
VGFRVYYIIKQYKIMDIYEILKKEIISSIALLYKEIDLLDIKNLTVEVPRNPEFGELSTNAAMILAKLLKENPRNIALKLKEHLNEIPYVDQITIEGSGFINFILTKNIWYDNLRSILSEKDSYGRNNIGANSKVNLEFVSANPTGLLHIGHTRGAIYGDALANLLKFSGYNVIKEFYVNDAGEQIKNLVESAFLRYREFIEKKPIPIKEGLYPGEYLIQTGEKLYKQFDDKLLTLEKNELYNSISEIVVNDMLDLIKQDLKDLNVFHEIFFSEKTLHLNNKIDQVIEKLKSIGLIYEGQLEAPKGKATEDWTQRKQLLFKSTNYGDDVDRPLKKADGSWTYFASEIAYVQNKIDRGFTNLIFIFGADHGGYIARTKSLVCALGNNQITCDIKISQLVKFLQNGIPVKMSKRKGTFTSAREVIEEVGSDVVRFMMLTRKNDIELEFDLEKVKEQSKDNPVFYVQYAHVRCFSLIEKANTNYSKADLKYLTLDIEIDLIRFLLSFPHLVKGAALTREPHKIAFYLISLASKFHSLWNYSDMNGLTYRFIIDGDDELTLARLYLVDCVKQVLKNGLNIIGVDPIDRM